MSTAPTSLSAFDTTPPAAGPARRHSQEQVEAALQALLDGKSYAEAGRRAGGVSTTTVRRWALAAGMVAHGVRKPRGGVAPEEQVAA